MDKKTNTEKKKIWIVLAVEVVFFLLLGLILSLMQVSYLTNKQASDSENKLADIIVNKQENDEEAIRIESDFNLSYINKAKTLSYYLDAPDTPIGSDKEAEILQDDYMVDGLYVLSSNKEIIATGVDNVTISFKDDTYSSLFTKDGSILTKDDNRFFSYSFTNGYIVLEKSIDGLNASLSNIKSLTYLLSSVEVGEGGYIFAVSKETKEVLYYPISSYIGSSANSIGVNDSSLNDNYAGWLSLKEENGSANYYCVSKSGEDYIFYIAAVPQVTLTKSTTEIVVIALIMCLVAVSDSLVYILIVKRDFKRHKKEYQTQVGKKMYYASGVSKKVLPISIFGVLCVFLLSLYTQTLFMISKQSNASILDLNQVEVALNENQNNIKSLRESYNEEYLSRCYSVATLVSQNESYYLDVDTESHKSNGLINLADGLGLEAIYVFDFNTDSSGNEIVKTIATSAAYYDFTLDITDPTAQSYPFYNVAKGYSE